MRGHDRRGAIAAVALAVFAALIVAVPAQADDFGLCNDNTGCRPDNFEHTFCWDSTYSSPFYNAATYAMGNVDTQTSYWDTRMSPCTSSTDVRFQQTNAPGSGTRGDYLCLAKNSAGDCERSRVRLNPDLLTDTTNRQKTACHEVGHSGGLTHGDTFGDCMRNGYVTGGYQTYNAHHIGHLNDRA